MFDAIGETEEALGQVVTNEGRAGVAERRVASVRIERELQRRRYAAGVAFFDRLTEAERRSIAVEGDLVAIAADMGRARIQLWRALGGVYVIGAYPATRPRRRRA